MRIWISAVGSKTHPLSLRGEIEREGYAWWHRQTQEAIALDLEPVWHVPLGVEQGSVYPTSCGWHAPGFPALMEACQWLRQYATMPVLFVGMRSHDPTQLFVANTARYLDVHRFAADRGILTDNLNMWVNVGLRTIILDNSSMAKNRFDSIKEYAKAYYDIDCEMEGMDIENGVVLDRYTSTHMDNIMERSHPDAVGNRKAHVVVQKHPGRSIENVIASMTRWHDQGFSVDYQGTLDTDVIKHWQTLV